MTKKILDALRMTILTFRLALPKLGVGWMFTLLTVNFNRIAIHELNVTAVAVTALLAFHYLLSPFQVISGRFADTHPIAGYRRTPYLIISAIFASIAFLGLPSVASAMGKGEASGFLGGLLIFLIFGICIAIMGDSHHSLIAERVSPRARGGVISVVWTFTILSTIISAIIMQQVMPDYTPALMQELYNMTPAMVIGSVLLGIVGIEKRLSKDELAEALEVAKAAAPVGNPIGASLTLLRSNTQARAFFTFVFISILSIFLQDNILEVFGAEVFGMSVAETTGFQPTWGGGVLLGMLSMGLLSVMFSISKRTIVLLGCLGTALGMSMMAVASITVNESLVDPSLIVMGLFTGFFNVGALSMMMDMTIEGATGLFMGLWGMAQAFGNGVASFGGGALHTGLIETGLLAPSSAYLVIFGIEAIGMVAAAAIMWRLSVQAFRREHAATVSTADALRAMEAGAVA